MDHMKVLKRAWEITWRYRVLWVFGVIVALTTARSGGNGGGGPQLTVSGEDWARRGGLFPMPEIPSPTVGVLIGIGVGLACLVIILAIAATIARYVAETALIRMVDRHEETGEKESVRQGFRMGWSRTALRLFLIDLLIILPMVVVFILLFLLVAAPLLLWATENTAAGVIGTVATVGLFFLALLLAIVVGTVVSLLMHFFRRACALEELGVIEAIRRGFTVVRQHLKDVAIMWLIMVGLSIGWVIAMIPVVILLVLLAGVVGGLPALLAGGLARLALEGATPWILAAVVGLAIFVVVMAVPMLFLGGLVEVFKSSLWTLTYRELRALEGLATEPRELPEPDVPGQV